MNWINLNVTTLDSEEFLGAEPEQRATWLCLLRFCAGQENGGRITAAKSWTDRKWQQVVRVTEREISTACDLWWWEGDDLVVAFYPSEKEEEVRQRRESASKGGKARKANADAKAKAKAEAQEGNEAPRQANAKHVLPDSHATCFKIATAEGEGERKEKEKEKGNPPNPPEGVCRGGSDDDPDKHRHEAPPAAAEDELHVLPRRWRHIARSERKNHRVHCNNRVMQRIGTWFGRKPEMLWNLAEGLAISQLDPPRDDVDLLERYYLAPLDRDADYRRRDLITLLNNWHGELDRARIWQTEEKSQ